MTTHALAKPTNLDFEEGTLGDVRLSWDSPTQQRGYTVRLSEKAPKRGRRCVEIAKTDVGDAPETSFGKVTQMIDATPFRGKQLRFTGWAKTRSVIADWLKLSSSRAQAWLRVDQPLGTTGSSDNMQERPIRSSN